MKSVYTLCLFIISFYAWAQEETEEQVDSVYNLEEIVVSASRWEQNLYEVPNKVSVVNSSLVQFQNPQTAADLLALSNSVFIQKSQLGGGSPMIRGFATNRVLLVVDGIRMNNAIFRSGNVQNVISLDANAIEEAEVIFGPGSVIYGSDAIGGVMDFHTLKPQFSAGEDLKTSIHGLARYSTANHERTAHLDFNLGGKNLAFTTSVTRSVYDHLRMGSNGPSEYLRPEFVQTVNGTDGVFANGDPQLQLYTGYDQWNAMQKISFRTTDWFNATYAFHVSGTSDYGRYDRLILNQNASYPHAEWYYGPQKWMLHSLNLTYSKPTLAFDQVRIIFGFQDYSESRHNRSFGSARKTNRFENVKAFSVNLDWDKKFNDAFTFYYGAELVTNTVGSEAYRNHIVSGEMTPVSTRYPDDARWRTYAAYFSLKFKPATNWLINAGGRFTHVHTSAQFDRTFFDFPFTGATLDNSAINGSLGVIYSPTPSWKIYSSLSNGFRAPNVDDIGKVFDSEPGNVVVPNPDLKAERAYNIEFGAAGLVRDIIKLDAAAYCTILDDAIARGPSVFNGQDSIDYDGVRSRVLSQQNISEMWVAGIQLGLDVIFNDAWRFSSSFNYQKGEEKDPETGRDVSPAHVAPSFGSVHVIYHKNNFKADVFANYNGAIKYSDLALSERADRHLYAKDGDGNPYAPAWLTLNLKTEFKFKDHYSIIAGVENILDKRYRPYSSGISAPGRNVVVSARINF